ncbi:hypothetical protein WN55_07446 [Dufourea novaeangliae]|uniref:Uncharacterized protein n=1 Tax=Dufourea novaeangliae TaxID=178035 RepID=A0A154PS91_DUFNO|nr:hypothetical protein WN55_07446 [Dufourea novaeangliae]
MEHDGERSSMNARSPTSCRNSVHTPVARCLVTFYDLHTKTFTSDNFTKVLQVVRR